MRCALDTGGRGATAASLREVSLPHSRCPPAALRPVQHRRMACTRYCRTSTPSERSCSSALLHLPPELDQEGGGGGCGQGSAKSNCEKLREITEKRVAKPNVPKPQRAKPLHRGHAGHQQARKVDKRKAIAEKLRKNAGTLRTPTPPPRIGPTRFESRKQQAAIPGTVIPMTPRAAKDRRSPGQPQLMPSLKEESFTFL